MSDPIAPSPESLHELRRQIGGLVLTPDDADYGTAIASWNVVGIHRAAVVVIPEDASDVAAAVRFAADANLGIGVQATGHGFVLPVDGLLIVTFDESDAEAVSKPGGGLSLTYEGKSCCGQQPGPNLGAFPETVQSGRDTLTFESFGGDRIGTVLISPAIKPGIVSSEPYNHYALLKSLEDLFGISEHLGYAGQAGLKGFGRDV